MKITAEFYLPTQSLDTECHNIKISIQIHRNRMVFHERVLLIMVTMSRPGNYDLSD